MSPLENEMARILVRQNRINKIERGMANIIFIKLHNHFDIPVLVCSLYSQM